ncbi:hypothetical protein [Phenylobacterium sp.]|jgi:hypothetical protein|uniref:hypothetical protein n=1 Tax=Phenylobacterium sp. TaxID=1871053 RepID=UPI002F41426B
MSPDADANRRRSWLDDPEHLLSNLRSAADAVIQRAVASGIGFLRNDRPDLDRLRGAAPASGGRLDYVADLSDPAMASALTTRAGRDGYAYIDEYPATNLGVRTSYEQLRSGVRDLVAGRPVDASALGPHVSYVNDDPGAPSSRQPVTASTAGMVAAAILDAGLTSANINSTTGGMHQKGSNHYKGRAMDINRVDGLPVGGKGASNTDPAATAAYTSLQNALRRQPNIRENFGPAFQEKTARFGFAPTPVPSLRASHQNHVHAGGQR